MKNNFLLSALIPALFFLTSFSGKNTIDFIGVYGVSDDDPAQIKLTLRENHTFDFRDFSNPAAKIETHGTWERKGTVVELREEGSNTRFHNRWHFTRNGKVANSRKGMTFYSLCKISD